MALSDMGRRAAVCKAASSVHSPLVTGHWSGCLPDVTFLAFSSLTVLVTSLYSSGKKR